LFWNKREIVMTEPTASSHSPTDHQGVNRLSPDLRLVWLFGPGANPATHQKMAEVGAQVLIQDLEDSTPPNLRAQARALASTLYPAWRLAGALVCVRINSLESEGLTDLAAVMPFRPDIIAYPKAAGAGAIQALAEAMTLEERGLGLTVGSTEILPVCETALGVVTVREMAAASTRIKAALLGSEDLATDLCAERGQDAVELDYARRRFLLECRAAGIEPVDAPFTFADAEAAAQEARFARRLGYRCKSTVTPEHTAVLIAALSPSPGEIAHARLLVTAFEAGRANSEDRVKLGEHWIEVPTYLNAKRLLDRAQALGS
jgi:citrate lyase subunit beta / citryl-CoA lyase